MGWDIGAIQKNGLDIGAVQEDGSAEDPVTDRKISIVKSKYTSAFGNSTSQVFNSRGFK